MNPDTVSRSEAKTYAQGRCFYSAVGRLQLQIYRCTQMPNDSSTEYSPHKRPPSLFSAKKTLFRNLLTGKQKVKGLNPE